MVVTGNTTAERKEENEGGARPIFTASAYEFFVQLGEESFEESSLIWVSFADSLFALAFFTAAKASQKGMHSLALRVAAALTKLFAGQSL